MTMTIGFIKDNMRTADIPNSNYYIREDGKVFRKSDNKEVEPKTDYLFLNINKKKRYIHRMVAEFFVEKKKEEYNVVDHINGDRQDNRAENLRWTDAKGNSNNMVNNVPERQKDPKAYDLEYSRNYSKTHRKERAEHQREYRKRHPEVPRAACKRWREKNKKS